MFRSWFRGCVLALASLFAMTSVVPAQAQSSDKLKLSYVAPYECILFFTWNGWTKSDPKSTNRTEKLFAEESVQDFGKQLMDEVTKLINSAAAAQGNEEATVAAQVGPTLAKLLERDLEESTRAKIDGTPTFYVDGYQTEFDQLEATLKK